MPSRTSLLRALALTVGCLAKFSSGSIFAFNVYSNAIKATFNYTQTEVLFLASMVNLGLGVGLPAGMVFDRFGPVLTSLIGLLSTSGGYLLIWSTFSNPAFYAHRNRLMGFYFFIVVGQPSLFGRVYRDFDEVAKGYHLEFAFYSHSCSVLFVLEYTFPLTWQFASHGALYTYMSALGTNVSNFHSKHRAKVIGLLDACFGGSPFFFVLIYSAFFVDGHVKDQQKQNVGGFMLLFAIWFGVVNFLCVLFLRAYPPEDPPLSGSSNESCIEPEANRIQTSDVKEYEATTSQGSIKEYEVTTSQGSIKEYQATTSQGSINCSPDSETREQTTNDETPLLGNFSKAFHKVKQILLLFLERKFEYLLWMFVFAAVVGLAFVNNVTVVTKSVGLSQYDTTVTALIPVSGIVGRFVLGPLSDHVKNKFSRTKMLLITNSLFALSQLICIFLADKKWAFILANVVSGVSIGSLWTFTPALVSEFYGLSDFGRNWGVIILVEAVVGIGVQEAYGKIYQSFIPTPNEIYCYGLICVKWDFVMMLGLTVCAILLNIFLILTPDSTKPLSKNNERSCINKSI